MKTDGVFLIFLKALRLGEVTAWEKCSHGTAGTVNGLSFQLCAA